MATTLNADTHHTAPVLMVTALVPSLPLHQSNILSPQATTATASSPSSNLASPSALGGGPTSASYVVPPRPKPGRKPATDEPANKRKAQNRESQRAFRARKAAKVEALQQQADHAERQHKEQMNEAIARTHELAQRTRELEQMVHQHKTENNRLSQERDWWKNQCAEAQRQVTELQQRLQELNGSMPALDLGDKQAFLFPQSLPTPRQDSPTHVSMVPLPDFNPQPNSVDFPTCGKCIPGGECSCLNELAAQSASGHDLGGQPFIGQVLVPPISPVKATPVSDPFAERETDFTAQFARKGGRPMNRAAISFVTEAEADVDCGFCDGGRHCVCKDTSLHPLNIPQAHEEPTLSDVKSLPLDPTATGPGSCAECQANPRQREWCQKVALNKNAGRSLDTMEPRITDASATYGEKSSIGCSEAFKLFDGRVSMDNDKMDWVGSLRPLSNIMQDTPSEQTRKYSALELDTASVIATLGSTMQPLRPRASDGENVSLILKAQEFQSSAEGHRDSSNSPGLVWN